VAKSDPGLEPNLTSLKKDLKKAVQRRSPSNRERTENERICREEWEKHVRYRFAKLVESYPGRLEVLQQSTE
jgi:thymidylate kinase